MIKDRDTLKKDYSKYLKKYVRHANEKILEHAYNLGKNAINNEQGELFLTDIHKDVLIQLIDETEDNRNYQQVIEKANDFLVESLAPFEMRQKGYEEAVDHLKNKNKEIKEINRKLKNEISERRKMENELTTSKRYYQSLIENAQDVITILNMDGKFRYESPSLEKVTGYKPSELIGKRFHEFIHPDDLKYVVEVFEKAIKIPNKTESLEYRFLHKEGYYITLHSMAKNLLFDDAVNGVVINTRDITRRKETEINLKNSEKQLKRAQQIANVGSWQWEIEQDHIYWSDEMYRIYGLNHNDFDGSYQSYMKFIHPDDRDDVSNYIEKALKNKKQFKFEHRTIRPDGDIRTLVCRGQVIVDVHGRTVKMLGTAQDITEHKEAEQKIRKSREQLRNLAARIQKVREEERTRIAREIHDELGQMLTVLKMDISLVKNQVEAKCSKASLNELNEIVGVVDTIITSVQRISSELRPDELDDVGLIGAIEWHIEEIKNKRNLNIDFDYGIDLEIEKYLNDEQITALFRIFQEAMTNILRHADAKKVDIKLEHNNENIVLNINDDGKGISKQQLNNNKSLGIIGMRERSILLGGKINFDSGIDEGTSITIKVPVE